MSSFTTRNDDQWKKPSGDFLRMRMVEISGLMIGGMVLAGITSFFIQTRSSVLLFVAFLLIGSVWLYLERRRVRSWTYCERHEELLIQHGLLIRRLTIVPYGRMQFIDVTAGPFERIFGLATVQLHTAAAATDARIPGLKPEEAQRLRDQLTSKGEARLSGL